MPGLCLGYIKLKLLTHLHHFQVNLQRCPLMFSVYSDEGFTYSLSLLTLMGQQEDIIVCPDLILLSVYSILIRLEYRTDFIYCHSVGLK